MSSTPSKRDDLASLINQTRSIASPFRNYLNDLHRKHASLKDGEVANYIPELARVDPELFGISVVTVDGKVFNAGHADHRFTIQSISKPFVFGLALEKHGRELVNSKVGVEPTGDAFNSLIRLDERSKRPHNPMVNAGAIATASLIQGPDPTDRLKQLLDMFRKYTGRTPDVDMSVFVSERSTGHRNRAIAHLMLNFGMIDPLVDQSLDLYFQQCSLLVSANDLAMMGASLANKGVNPKTGERAIPPEYIRDVLSVMLTCGMYDGSGEWVYRIGLPAKSGVGGGILTVIPGKMAIGTFSPRLDSRGNSTRGIAVCQDIVQDLGLHMFEAAPKATHLMPV